MAAAFHVPPPMSALPALRRRLLAPALVAAAVPLAALGGSAPAASFNGGAPAYAPGEVVVGYDVGGAAADGQVQVLHVAPGEVRATVARLRRTPGVAFAAPNPIAHASETVPLPDDPGIRAYPGGLAALQWNFFGPFGVDALGAWSNVAARAPGGRGVRIAVLDTGIAYRDLGRFRRSPDFAGTKFVAPYDFVDRTPYPVDRNGHGTHVAGTIA